MKLHFRESAHSYRYFHFPISPVHPLDQRHKISRNLLLGNLHKQEFEYCDTPIFLVHPRRSSPSTIIFTCLPKPPPAANASFTGMTKHIVRSIHSFYERVPAQNQILRLVHEPLSPGAFECYCSIWQIIQTPYFHKIIPIIP